MAPVIHLCVRAQQGRGLPGVGTGSSGGSPGQQGRTCSPSHPTPYPGAGQPGALGLVGAGDRQCCSITGAGADDPRENEMGSWAVGRVRGGPGEGARSQMITADVS